MSSVIHQPNDKFYKLSMGELSVAQDFLRAYLPEGLSQKIDWSTLKPEKNSFIDPAYNANEADVIYSFKLKEHTAYVYTLCEQQTEIDVYMAFRLLTYMMRLIETHHRQHPNAPLPLVYPIVIYSGERVWNAPLEIFPLFGEHEALAREFFLKPYRLLDLQRMSDETLQQQKFAGIMTLALKYRQLRDAAAFLNKLLPKVESLENQPGGLYLARIVLQYILNDIDADDLPQFYQQINQHLSTQLKGEAMTLAECLRQEGMQQGIQQGMQQGMQQGREQGIQQGMQQGEAALMLRLLQRRFGTIPTAYTEMIYHADPETLLQWGEKVLDARSLDEIFC